MAYTDILPDPNNLITDSGKAIASGGGGEGFASLSLSSTAPVMLDRTNSGRVISRAVAAQNWSIDVKYNPMTREQFEPVYNFILQRGRLTPFKVSLPQNKAPRDTDFATFVAATDGFSPVSNTNAGTNTLTFDKSGYTVATNRTPLPGDLFNISDSNHHKTYRVTRVETTSDNSGVALGANEVRIQFTPPLAKAVTLASSELEFNNPMIRVLLASDVQQYSLNVSNLYSFSLKLQEAL